MYFLLSLLLSAIISVLCDPAISLTVCPPGDDDCVTKAVQAVFPLILEPNSDISAEQMDPMYQEVIEGDLSILKFKLFNTTVTGFKTCDVENAKLYDAADSMNIELFCKKFTLDGQYDIHGRLIVLPIEGNGDYSLYTNEYKLTLKLILNTVNKNEKSYRQIKSFTVDADPIGPINYDFKGLFNGQQELADVVLTYANGNWKEVAHHVQGPVFVANIKKIVKNANKYLKNASN